MTKMDFDPNDPKKQTYPWATYLPYRSPKFKLHASRGPALNAFKYNDNAILYKWDDAVGRWDEVFRIEDWKQKDHPNCEGCGQPTLKKVSWGMTNEGNRIWVDKKTDHPRLIWACYACVRQLR